VKRLFGAEALALGKSAIATYPKHVHVRMQGFVYRSSRAWALQRVMSAIAWVRGSVSALMPVVVLPKDKRYRIAAK
jgi:hypothetical protein